MTFLQVFPHSFVVPELRKFPLRLTDLLASKIKFAWLFFSNRTIIISWKWKGPPFIWTARERVSFKKNK